MEWDRNQQGKPTLKRKLGLVDAVSIGLGAIIGAGIFVLIGIAAGMAGPGVFVSVIISGLSATFTALSFAELGAAMPRAGGVYEYGHELISHPVGFSMGWLFVFGNLVLGATASLAFGYYLTSVFGFIPFKLGALMILLLVVFFNVIGVKQSALLNDFLVFIKIAVLLLFILMGLPRIQMSYFENLFPNGLLPVMQAAALFYFAYIGFPRITTTAEEIKEPERSIPLAILIALSLSSLIYLLTSVTAVGLIGYERLGGSLTPVADAADGLGLRDLVEVGALVATFSVILTSVMGQSRVFFAMARNDEMPYLLSRIHKRFETPVYSVLLSGIVMVILASTIDIAGLASLASFCILLTHILTNYSAFKLHRSTSAGGTSFKAPMRPFHAVIGFLLSAVLALSLGVSTIGMGLVACFSGLGWYAIYTKIIKKRGRHQMGNGV